MFFTQKKAFLYSHIVLSTKIFCEQKRRKRKKRRTERKIGNIGQIGAKGNEGKPGIVRKVSNSFK